MDSFVEVLKLLLPASLVLYAMYLTIKIMVSKTLLSKEIELKQKSLEIILPLRLQAFERVTLFLERISIDNLLLRVNKKGISASILHAAILDEIRKEFNHNIAQQVYLSKELWNMVVTAKENLVTKINVTYKESKTDDASLVYAKKLLTSMASSSDTDSIELALDAIKDELSKYYQI